MLTLNDLVNARLKIGRILNDTAVSDAKVLRNLIEDDRRSKQKKDMIDGMTYYEVGNKILKRVKTYKINEKVFVDDISSNNKVAHAFHTILVDQKVNYIVGEPIKFISDNQDFLDRVNEILNYDEFDELINSSMTNACNKGYDVIFPYLNDEGELKFTSIPSEQTILIYDDSFNKTLVGLVRYYYIYWVDDRGNETKKTKAEWWTKNNVSYYIETKEGGEFVLDVEIDTNPAFHFYKFNSLDLSNENKEGFSWNRVPFIIVYNNNSSTPDLNYYKTLIDDYDFNVSEFSNELSDIMQQILNIKDFDGEDLEEFLSDLKRFRVVKTHGTGGVEPISNGINATPRDSHLDRIYANIFIMGMGINPRMDKIENPSGVMLKILFSLLDIKANKSIRKLKRALTDFIWFIVGYLSLVENAEYEINDIDFEVQKATYTNEGEVIDNLVKSEGMLSEETTLEKHPYVTDVADEIDRKEKEGLKEVDLNNVPPDETVQ